MGKFVPVPIALSVLYKIIRRKEILKTPYVNHRFPRHLHHRPLHPCWSLHPLFLEEYNPVVVVQNNQD